MGLKRLVKGCPWNLTQYQELICLFLILSPTYRFPSFAIFLPSFAIFCHLLSNKCVWLEFKFWNRRDHRKMTSFLLLSVWKVLRIKIVTLCFRASSTNDVWLEFQFWNRRDHRKISFEHRVYESVDDRKLS